MWRLIGRYYEHTAESSVELYRSEREILALQQVNPDVVNISTYAPNSRQARYGMCCVQNFSNYGIAIPFMLRGMAVALAPRARTAASGLTG